MSTGSAAGNQRSQKLPAPRRRHINGRIVEVLCAWLNGSRYGCGQAPSRMGKVGTCAIYISGSETDERHSYYGNVSYPENI